MEQVKKITCCFSLSVICCFLFTVSVVADVRLPHVIGSHMVLQRDMSVPIWGWADSGERVVVTFNGNKVEATADADGNWKVKLPAQKAEGPFRDDNYRE